MGIEIPKRLNDHLLKDDHWYGCVTSAKSKIEYFLSESPLFFPDYTGHGIEHINQVLIAADKLIRDDAFHTDVDKDEASGILEPMDLAYLICAIMIHDMGMFLKKDGAEKVINSACGRPIPRIGDDSWKNLWQDYFDSTHRSTQSAMRRQFGKIKSYSEDCFATDNMGEDERRFIGEFLRRHHGRLAHEIALRGLPGSTTIDIFDGCDLADSDREMIGILARSHTMAIRDTEGYLKTTFEEGSMPENTPVFFLMSVLRIADLLDAGNHRAPELLFAHQSIYVPASEEEWAWNQRIILSKCRWNPKNKSRSIYAEPKCSVEYVQLDKWLRWVQSELDMCWSILAERYPDGYRLSIHRVTSRIHQPEYHKKMNETFLPREVTISANPEITQLLIAPLYGNDPSFGVRELLQNAVDACEERRYREPGYKGQVTIRIDPRIDLATGENRGVFTIEDNGVGMSEHVLINYYLSAGSSYRNSEEWKKEYTDSGRSQVARTGKFGIGFLAAFLLGDEIEVHTQYVSDELGYKFSFTNEAKPLNVVRKEREEPGTTITIQLKEGVWDKLKNSDGYSWFKWYAFDEPEVQYFFDGKQFTYEGLSLSRNPMHNPDWFRLDTKKYSSYLWHPNFAHGYFSPVSFLCNGIHIQNIKAGTLYAGQRLFSFSKYGLDFPCPHISLIDYGKRLDVDLARANISVIPEKDQLAKQVCLYHLSRLILFGWNKDNKVCSYPTQFPLRYPTLPILYTGKGFQINNAAVLSILQTEQIVLLYYDKEYYDGIVDTARQFIPADLPLCMCFDQPYSSAIGEIFDSNELDLSSYSDGYDASACCRMIWVNYRNTYEADHCEGIRLVPCEVPVNGMVQYLPFSFDEEDEIIDLPINWEKYNPDIFPAVFQILNPNKGGDTIFAEVLREVLEPAPGYDRNDIWIPFDMEERRKKFPKAFRVLKEYIDAIEDNPEAHHVNI